MKGIYMGDERVYGEVTTLWLWLNIRTREKKIT